MKGEFLVLAATPNDAKRVESHLRSSGHPVRMLVAPGIESFIDILVKSPIEVILQDDAFTEVTVAQVVEAVNRNRPNTPIVLMTKSLEPQRYVEAVSSGARGIVSVSDLPHLELVCKREFDSAQTLRALAGLRVKLAQAETAYAAFVGSSDEPMIQVQEGIILSANNALADLLGVAEPDDIAGLPLMDLVREHHQPVVKERIKSCLKGKDSGEPVSIEMYYENNPGAMLEARLVKTDIDGDPAIEIVGLPSGERDGSKPGTHAGVSIDRTALAETLVRYSARKNSDNVNAVVLINVDEFDHIEDRVGLCPVVNLVDDLVELVNQISDSEDRVFRFSMHEVVIVGRRPTLDEFENAMKRFQRALARYIFKVESKEIAITTSAVIYPLPEEPEEPDVTLRHIRKAARALELDGGGVRVSGSAAENLERKRVAEEWEQRIRRALNEGRFELAYQNIASLAGDERQTSDVLVRMIDEDGNEIVAAKFIQYAEERGLMVELDRWIIGTAIRKLQMLDADGKKACFFVRIAEQSLAEIEDFHEWIVSELKEHPIGQNELVVTLRERTLQNHMKKGQWLSAKSKTLGVSLAIDHFGITRHSPQLLARLPIHYVKLHADFTEAIGKPGTDLKPLEAIMESARQNQIRTIAERVTDANSMARLWQLGVNYIMGSHVHEPETVYTDQRFRLN